MELKSPSDLRALYLKFFREHGHAVIPSASIIPENDPSVLFTTAGMHPLVPYLLGMKHPMGTRLTDVQKCIRTGDIDDVGDASHLTFFEMLGNWSLGDYFKKEAIHWSWEFLTSPEYLGIPKEKLAFSVFAGDEKCARDEEAASYWRECGVADDHIFYLSAEHNWWIAGTSGPCGPDTEMFIITDKEPCGPDCSPACSCGRYLEIWNDVFMQFDRQPDGTDIPLGKPNVDTGMGLERTFCVLKGVKSVYDTELFARILGKASELCGHKYVSAGDEHTKSFRVIADHMRTSTFILGDDRGVTPSNVDQGYVLRRLLRRAVRHGMRLGMPEGFTSEIARVIIDQYGEAYPELQRNADRILEQLQLEEERFQRTLKRGEQEFDKLYANMNRLITAFDALRAALSGDGDIAAATQGCLSVMRPSPDMVPMIEMLKSGSIDKDAVEQFAKSLTVIDGRNAFKLYDTYGFPIEITMEMASEKGLTVDEAGFADRFKQHQETSHAGAEQKFKGGLAERNDETAKLHTATHLLHAALRHVLGDEVAQKGSNITTERLRFDFTFGRKMTPEEVAETERLVNEYIAAKAPINCEEMTVEEARAQGAIGLFASKYGERVKVYTMGSYSKEICGGPHAENTGDLVNFKIQKEESSSAGVRRIKAVINV